MFLYKDYLNGKGLNISDYDAPFCTKAEKYTISVQHKYEFVIFDYSFTHDLYSEINNFNLMLKEGGYFILRQKLEHPEQYKKIFSFKKDFSINNLYLKNFFIEDNIASFIFKKQKPKNGLYIGVVSENKERVINTLKKIRSSKKFSNTFLIVKIFSKDEYWKDKDFYEQLTGFSALAIFILYDSWYNNVLSGWNHHINQFNGKNLFLIDDTFNIDSYDPNIPFGEDYILIEDVNSIRKLNGIDFRYKTLRWGIFDLAKRLGEKVKTPKFNEHDYYRYNLKNYRNVSREGYRDITIAEALGDNILCFNLIEGLIRKNIDVNVRTMYPFLYSLSPEVKIDDKKNSFMDSLGFTVYEHGDALSCKTLEQAYFSMLGYPELYKKQNKNFTTLKYINEYREKYGNKLILLAPSASNYEGLDNGIVISNKSWPVDRWEKIIEYLKDKGYIVVQVGASSDLQVENVNEKFFDKSFEELVNLIKVSKFFLSIDTFFQHLCGLMNKKGVVLTPRHNEHAYWPSIEYIQGTNYKKNSKEQEKYEHLKWIKDHLNPYRKPCMESITEDQVKEKIDNLINRFDKY